MDAVIALSIMGIGYYLNRFKNNQREKKHHIPNKKYDLGVENIYESQLSKKINHREKELANDMSIRSKYPQVSNIVNSNTNLKLSNINKNNYRINDSSSPLFNDVIKNKIKRENDLVYVERPTSTRLSKNNNSNNVNNNKKSNIEENFFVSPLSGMSISKNDFTHNNMVPFFGGSVTQNTSETANSPLLETFTGNNKYHIDKKERTPLFNPEKNMYHVHGSPNMSSEMYDRMIPSRFKNNESPIEKQNVGPGLNQGYVTAPSGGFQQADTRQYILPKTTDELRTANNPKLSFKGVIVPGKHMVTKSGKIGKVNKNQPDTFYINSPCRYNVTTGAFVREKSRPIEIVKCTARQSTSSAYQGSAGPAGKKGDRQIPLYRQSCKPVYKTQSTRNLNQTGQWDIPEGEVETNFDYGKSTTYIDPTEREVTESRTHISNINTYVKAITAPIQDIFKTSRKENFIGNERQSGNFSVQIPNKQTIYDPNDVARTTIKETNIHDNRSGNLSGPSRIIVYDPNDIARTTIKETNINDNRTGNMRSGVSQLPAYDPNDTTRTTIKETNIHDNRTGNIKTSISQLPAYDPNDITKTTIKETNIHDNNTGYMGSGVTQLPAYDPNDITRTTIKETNIHDNRSGNMTSGVNQLPIYDPNDITRTTIKETNIHDNRSGNITSGVVQLPSYDPNDITRTTIKETNIHDNRSGNIESGVNQLPVYDPNDVSRTTIKETNIHDNRSGNIRSGVNQLPVYDPNDVTRTTIKETNIHDNRSGNMSSLVSQLPTYDPNDVTRTTIKETNIHDNRTGNINRSGIGQVPVYDPNDITRTTIKETNIHNNRTGNIGSLYSGDGQGGRVGPNSRNPDDIAKTTVRETTDVEDSVMNFGVQSPPKATVYDPEDATRTTIKETNIHDNRTGNVTSLSGSNKGYLTNDIQVPNTNKQFTSDISYIGQSDGDNNGGGTGYLTADVQAPNTNKQFTSDNDYTGSAQGSELPVSYESADAATYSGEREMVSQGRKPTQVSVNIPNGENSLNMEVKKIEGDIINTRDLSSTIVYNSIKQPQTCSVTTEKQQYNQELIDERNQPDILTAFKENPYTQPLDSFAFP